MQGMQKGTSVETPDSVGTNLRRVGGPYEPGGRAVVQAIVIERKGGQTFANGTPPRYRTHGRESLRVGPTLLSHWELDRTVTRTLQSSDNVGDAGNFTVDVKQVLRIERDIERAMHKGCQCDR